MAGALPETAIPPGERALPCKDSAKQALQTHESHLDFTSILDNRGQFSLHNAYVCKHACCLTLITSWQWNACTHAHQVYTHLLHTHRTGILIENFPCVDLYQEKDRQGEYIRRALAWRDKMWQREGAQQGRPSSYLLTLLVVRAYEEARKKLGVFSSMSPETLALQWVITVQTKCCPYLWCGVSSLSLNVYPHCL